MRLETGARLFFNFCCRQLGSFAEYGESMSENDFAAVSRVKDARFVAFGLQIERVSFHDYDQ